MDSSNFINVAKYIIRNTPIGHLKETLENLKNLIGPSITEEKEIQDEITSYEEEHFKQVPLNEDKFIVSKFNKDDEGYYHDQTKRLKISISPLNENIEKLVEIESPSTVRDLIDKHLEQYKEKFYKSGITGSNTYFIQQVEDKWKIILLISSHNLNHKNFWCGEWLSCWELDKVGSNSYTLKGTVRANTYYYEEGNIQFNLKTNFEEKLSSETEGEELARDVFNLIEARENKIQLDLDQVYDDFSDNYIKPLRRKLPVTGSKMNWNLNQIGLK